MSEPHIICVQVYFPQREGGAIYYVPLNATTRPLLAELPQQDDVYRADALTAQPLWDLRLPHEE